MGSDVITAFSERSCTSFAASLEVYVSLSSCDKVTEVVDVSGLCKFVYCRLNKAAGQAHVFRFIDEGKVPESEQARSSVSQFLFVLAATSRRWLRRW